MKYLAIFGLVLATFAAASCSEKTASSSADIGLIGEWQSVDDTDYVLKLNTDTYREFYAAEEMSRDQWQPVKSCDNPQPVEKTDPAYGGFQIWTKETDSRICYAISNWDAENVSLTYAGTTSTYTRIN